MMPIDSPRTIQEKIRESRRKELMVYVAVAAFFMSCLGLTLLSFW